MFTKHPKPRPVPVAIVVLILWLCAVGTPGCSYVTALRCRSQIRSGLLTPRRHDPAHLDVRGNIPILHLYGTPEEMGTQYGTILREPLQALSKYVHALVPSGRLNRMLAYAEEQEPSLPDAIRAELRAISEASGMPYIDLVAMNVLPRIMCSGLAVSGEASQGGSLIMGRNAEYFAFGLADRGSMMVVYHSSEGLPVVAVSFIGLVGAFTGMNSEGVGFGNMLVFKARDDGIAPGGLPIQIAMRLGAHRSSSAGSMSTWLLSQKHVIPMNVMVADRNEAIVTELGLRSNAVRLAQRGVLASTNYFRTPGFGASEVACKRYARLMDATKKHRGSFDVALMKKALHAARIKNLNIQAAVLEPGAMRMHVCANQTPASAGPYTVFDVKKLCADKPGGAPSNN